MSEGEGDGVNAEHDRSPIRKPRASRKNLLLSATIEAGALKADVRIRNLSESGAMIEGAALPDVGSPLTLRRSEIEIGALVVWRATGRCGIRFDGIASVEEWVGGVRRPSNPLGGQARVDAVQAALRRGDVLPSDADPAPRVRIDAETLDRRIADELAYVRRLLDVVGDELTEDPIILQRHNRALQNFDVACQILTELGAILIATDPAVAIEAVTMQDLRSRLLRKPIF